MSAPAPVRRPAPARPPRPTRGPAGGQRLAVVPPPTARRGPTPAPRGPFIVFVLALLALGLMALLAVNTAVSQDAFTLNDLQQASNELSAKQEALAEQLAAAQSPASLAAQARRLGMVPAPRPVFLELPPAPAGPQQRPTAGPGRPGQAAPATGSAGGQIPGAGR